MNEANEITDISGTGNWIEPEYDNAGNMVSGPKPGAETTRLHFVYDAWNRQVAVKADDGGEPGDTLATYEFDGTGRRIEKHTTAQSSVGEADVDYLYNQNWQLLQSETDAGGPIAVDQYVWSVTYVDAPVVRFHDANGDGDYEDEGDNIRYFTRDANFNVTAAVEGTYSQGWSWQLEERYVYTPYGEATAYDADWTNPAAPTADGPLYCGYFFDLETSTYNVRARIYHSTLSTWLTRDPLGYSAGDENLYRYVANRPVGSTDPYGQKTCCTLARNPAITFGSKLSLGVKGVLDIDTTSHPGTASMKTTQKLRCEAKVIASARYNCVWTRGLWNRKTVSYSVPISREIDVEWNKDTPGTFWTLVGTGVGFPAPWIGPGVSLYKYNIIPEQVQEALKWCQEKIFRPSDYKNPPKVIELD